MPSTVGLLFALFANNENPLFVLPLFLMGHFIRLKKTYHSSGNVVAAGGKVMVCGRMVMCRRVSIVLVVVKSHVLYMALT